MAWAWEIKPGYVSLKVIGANDLDAAAKYQNLISNVKLPEALSEGPGRVLISKETNG